MPANTSTMTMMIAMTVTVTKMMTVTVTTMMTVTVVVKVIAMMMVTVNGRDASLKKVARTDNVITTFKMFVCVELPDILLHFGDMFKNVDN